jgi:hypothetical protein
MTSFWRALAECLAKGYGWPITERNVGIVNGS